MMLKVGVMGSSAEEPEETKQMAFSAGKEIARKHFMLVTGATTGISLEAAKGAKEEKGFVLGISPAQDLGEHADVFKKPTENFDVIIFTGMGMTQRNIINVRTSDAVVIICGAMGTLNEFTIAFNEGKLIGVLEGSGGIADKIKELVKVCPNKEKAKVIFGVDPANLVDEIALELEKK